MEHLALLTASWQRCWTELAKNAQGVELFQQLIQAYTEPQRVYHSIQHLADCLRLFQENRELASKPEEVEMALWFHDAIYDVTATDNEITSAHWAETALEAVGVEESSIQRIVQLILATRHTSNSDQNGDEVSADTALLLDIDLAILGASPARYAEFESQIRQEYGWVEPERFREGRLSILKRFQAQSPVYHTPKLANIWEKNAHTNLAWAITELERNC